MNKVYLEDKRLGIRIDSREIAKRFDKEAEKMSTMLLDLEDMRAEAESSHELAKDNYDVAFAIETAMSKLGLAIAWAKSYAMEYQEEADKVPEDGKEKENQNDPEQ